ncbi:glycosyltransferase family 25 protein [Devosia sp. MC532]|uniref:glycosyltransferase family 25 protein n=1 Tax=Devosia sp. MC532 TaxID=2799788 RepID=UPI0018F38C3E|nr:glycosyltransferase family 25 protein [Devosia sp. MC532]
MKIYYINLDHRTDRREAMERKLAALGLPATRIQAVTPAGIAADLVVGHTNLANVEHVRITELACALSHHRALEAFLATNDTYALILEDDVLLSNAVADLLQTPLSGFDILRLETYLDPQHFFSTKPLQLGAFEAHEIASRCAGAAAYIVNRDAARAILAERSALSRPYDFVLFFPFRKPGTALRAMQLVPALAIQEDRFFGTPYEGDVQLRTGKMGMKPRHLAVPHAIAYFWLSDAQINLIKFWRRLWGKTRRAFVEPDALLARQKND